MSQALIDELLSTWVTESIQNIDKDSLDQSGINVIPIFENIENSKQHKGERTHNIAENSTELQVNLTSADNHRSLKSSSLDEATLVSSEGQLDEMPLGDAPLSGTAPADNLFSIPPTRLTPDWEVVLGTFDHYDDNNWDNFLIQSG